MVVDISKLSKKDLGDYTISTDISLEGDEFKTTSDSFKLSIVATEKKGSKEAKSSNEIEESSDSDKDD